jgi:hypothetical protein
LVDEEKIAALDRRVLEAAGAGELTGGDGRQRGEGARSLDEVTTGEIWLTGSC